MSVGHDSWARVTRHQTHKRILDSPGKADECVKALTTERIDKDRHESQTTYPEAANWALSYDAGEADGDVASIASWLAVSNLQAVASE